MKLTLDATCIHDFFKRDKTCIQILIDDTRNGICDLAITSRIRLDIPRDPLASELNKLPELGIKTVGSVARWGVSQWGEDYWAGEETREYEEKIRMIMFPGTNHPRHMKDIDHLLGHIINKRDYFITSDLDFLDHRDQLKQEVGVNIITPQEYVDSVK